MRMTRTHWVSLAAVVLALLFAGAATVASAGGDDGPRNPSLESADAGFARDMSVHHQQAVEMSFIVRDRTGSEDVRELAYDIANTQANQRGMMLGWLDMWELPLVAADLEPMSWMASGDDEDGGDGHGGAHGGHGPAQPSGKPAAEPEAGAAGDGEKPLMPGMATRTQLDRLGKLEGRAAEVEFLRLMTAHHQGGVEMAEGCARLCEPGPQRKLARGMVEAQKSEMDLMAAMLRKRGA
jgi:uncharacterized protein (DUF305 family)